MSAGYLCSESGAAGAPTGDRLTAGTRPEAGRSIDGVGVAHILLLTGDRGAGKSTLCERLAEEAQRLGIPAGGVACPAVFGPDGAKIGCRVRNLATGEERELGSTARDLGGPRWKGWSFSREGFKAANRAVLAALERGAGLVILDEVGPVELRLGAGLEPSLQALDRMSAEEDRSGSGGTEPGSLRPGWAGLRLLLVVRTERAEELERRYTGSRTIRIDSWDRQGAFETARAALFGAPDAHEPPQSS